MHECHTVKSRRNVFTLKTNKATGPDGISDLFRHGYLELLEHLLLCRWLTYIYVRLYAGDLSEAVNSASLYMYAYDTTIYCIGESLDSVSNMLNNTLKK